MFHVKEVVCGPMWQAASFGDGLISRVVLCTAGACFLAMIPFAKLRRMAEESNPDREEGVGISRVADEFVSLGLEDVEASGGAYIFLRKGEGAVVPPGYFFFQCAPGYMKATPKFYKNQSVEKGCGTVCVAAAAAFQGTCLAYLSVSSHVKSVSAVTTTTTATPAAAAAAATTTTTTAATLAAPASAPTPPRQNQQRKQGTKPTQVDPRTHVFSGICNHSGASAHLGGLVCDPIEF